MQILTLTVKKIELLNTINRKLLKEEPLTTEDHDILSDFLLQLPSPSTLINERFPLDDKFEVKIIDMQEVMPHLEKWIKLFQNLPNNATLYPEAGWFDANEDCDFWRRNVIIEASFIPTLEHSIREENQTIGLNLKCNGTAEFEFYLVEDAKSFPDLFDFKGTWKEAYLLTVKTLIGGWPQTSFPEELERLLKN